MPQDLIKEIADGTKEAIKIHGPAIVTAIVEYTGGNLPNCYVCPHRSGTFDSRGSDKWINHTG